MPQIKLEYTDNVELVKDISKVFSEIHLVLNQTAGIKLENCKSRAVQLADYYIGEGGTDQAFVHLEVRILEGRSVDLKKQTGNTLLEILKTSYSFDINPIGLQITVEIIDIIKDFYFKSPEGTFTTNI